LHGLLKPRKCGQAKEGRNGERDLHTIYVYYRELRIRLADLREREREREREERGKGAFAVGDRFCRYHFFHQPEQQTLLCLQTTQCSKGSSSSSSSRPIIIWVCVEGYASTLVRIALSL